MSIKILPSLSNPVGPRNSVRPQSPRKGPQLATAKTGYLSEIYLFRDLSQDEVDWVASITTMTSCERGRVFYSPGETGEVLFLLKQGRVQLYRMTPEGKKIVVATLNAGTFFGEMSMLGQGMYNTFAEAAEDCVLCVMSRIDLERLLIEKPKVMLRLVQALGRRVSELENQLELTAFKTIRARLASLLLRLRAEAGTDEIIGYTHQDLAEMIGTYRETTTHLLNDLKTDKHIEIGRKKILILNHAGLREVAEG